MIRNTTAIPRSGSLARIAQEENGMAAASYRYRASGVIRKATPMAATCFAASRTRSRQIPRLRYGYDSIVVNQP